MSASNNHPFLDFPLIKPSLLMMGKKIQWKPNAIEVAPNCPRCFSSNTKFCYYNNYSVSQPRYFCKACRRYWTKGGSLRNVPIGGGCRKSRRTRTTRRECPPPDPEPTSAGDAAAVPPEKYDDQNLVKDYDQCPSFASSASVINGGDDQFDQKVHGSFDGQDFLYQNFDVFEVDGINNLGSEMLWSESSNLESFGCHDQQPPLMEMQEFEVFSSGEDQLRMMGDDNLITDNWSSFDLSAYDNF